LDDLEFRRTEGLLYGYYDNLRQLELLKDRINYLADDIKLAREAIYDEGRYQVANYSGVKTNGSKSVYKAPQETIYLQAEEYIASLEKQRLEMLRKVSKINQQTAIMNHALGQLDFLEQKVVKCLYCEKLSMRQTAMALNMASHNSISRIRERVIKHVSSFIKDIEI